MKELIRTLVLATICLSPALADSTSPTAQLLFHGNLMSSMTLVFQNNPAAGATGFCSLTSLGANFVFLNLGSASFVTPDSLACVQYSKTGNAYAVSSAFDVLVTITNSTSPSYQLAAEISTASPTGVTWLVNGATLSTAYTTIQTANPYAHPVTQTLAVNVKNSVAAQTLFESVNFLATRRIRICSQTPLKRDSCLPQRCWLSPVQQKVKPRRPARSTFL